MLSFGAVLHPRVRVLHQAKGLIALSKAAGVLSHPNQAADWSRSVFGCRYSMQEEVYLLGTHKLWLVHRIDSDTSGVLLVSEDEHVAKAVKREFASRTVSKEYLAIVFGKPSQTQGLWRDVFSPQKTAVTRFELLSTVNTFPMRSLLALYPSTGFKHQLRMQCARHGVPIVGDSIYGNFVLNREIAHLYPTAKDCMFLHASRVTLSYCVANESHSFTASDAPPQYFNLLQ